MKIHEIAKEFQNKDQGWFPYIIEHEMFNEALQCFVNKRYISSANTGFVLFERIFTSRLIRETSSPKGFVPSKSNVQEQLKNMLDKERKVVDGDDLDRKKGFSFYKVTEELKQLRILSKEEKDEYDDLYKDYRIPVMHGLSLRLYEKVFDKIPSHSFEPDVNYEKMYEEMSELIINKIYDLVSGGKFLKK